MPSLGAAAVAELVRRRLPEADDELCRRCLELTSGNPLQLRELLAAIEQRAQPADASTLPMAAEVAARSLARSVLRRLAALSLDAQVLARGVAVFEDDAPLHLAAELTGLSRAAALAAADELAAADVLRAGDPLGFTHPLVRSAVYGELPYGERARTHRRAAQLLVASGASSEPVSAHLLESSPDGDAVVVEQLRATAERAMARGVPASAVRYLERALREPPPEAVRPAVLSELGRAEGGGGPARRRGAPRGGDRPRRGPAAARRVVARVRPGAATQRAGGRRVRVVPAWAGTSSGSRRRSSPSISRRDIWPPPCRLPSVLRTHTVRPMRSSRPGDPRTERNGSSRARR